MRKAISCKGFIPLVVVLMLAASAPNALGADIAVSCPTTWQRNGSGTVANDARTCINTLITSATAGDVLVFPANTTYDILGTITVNKSLTLRGANYTVKPMGEARPAGETTLRKVNNDQIGSSASLILVSANNVAIEGFQLASMAAPSFTCGSPAVSCTGALYGIAVEVGRSNIRYSKNWFNLSNGGINPASQRSVVFGLNQSNFPSVTPPSFVNIEIDHNYFVHQSSGIQIGISGASTFSQLTIDNNVFVSGKYEAHVGTIYDPFGIALGHQGVENKYTIDDFVFTNNIVQNGIARMGNILNGTVSGNRFNESALNPAYLFVGGKNIVVSDNRFSPTAYLGLYGTTPSVDRVFNRTSEDVSIRNNKFDAGAFVNLSATGIIAATIHLNRNGFERPVGSPQCDSASPIANVLVAGPPVDSAFNWWGVGSGPVSTDFCDANFQAGVKAYINNLELNSEQSTAVGFWPLVATSVSTTSAVNGTEGLTTAGVPYTVSGQVTVSGLSGSDSGINSLPGKITFSDGTGGTCDATSLTPGTTAHTYLGSCLAGDPAVGTMTSPTAGTKTITSAYTNTEDPLFYKSSASGSTAPPALVHVVGAPVVTTTTLINIGPSPSALGGSYEIRYSVLAADGTIPPGDVRVRDGVLNASGTAEETCLASAGKCNLTSSVGGAKTITVEYLGVLVHPNTAAYGTSSDTGSHSVSNRNSVVTISSIAPATVGTDFVVSYSVASSPVCSSGCETLSGDVVISDGLITPVTCAATATSCSIPAPAAGSRYITVRYLGSSSYAASQTTQLHVIGKKTVSFTSLGVSTVTLGAPNVATYTLGVPASGVSFTGTVTLSNGTDSATCPVKSDGINGTCSLVATTNGAKTFTLTYTGDNNYTFSAGSPISNQTSASVNQPDTTVTFTLPTAGSVSTGETFRVSASVTAPSTTLKPSGTVAITVGTATCTGTILTTTGASSCDLVADQGGARNVTVVYSGDSLFDTKTVSGSFTIEATPVQLNISNVAPGSPTVGSNYAVSVSLSSQYGLPPGSIEVSENSTQICNIAHTALVNGSGTCGGWLATTAGVRTLTAVFTPASSANFAARTVTRTITVNGLSSSTAITASSPTSPAVGAAYTVTVQVSSATSVPAGGTVSLSDGFGGSGSCGSPTPGTPATLQTYTCTFTSVSAGGRNLTANFSGNTSLNASSGTRGITIAKAASTTNIGLITLTNSTPPSIVLIVNRPYTVNVTVTGGGTTPTGSVLISNSLGGSCSATLSGGSGSCSLQTATSGGTITASYGGNSNYLGHSTTFSPLALDRAPTTASIVTSGFSPAISSGVNRGLQYTVTARVDPQAGYGITSVGGGGTITIRATSTVGTVSCVAPVVFNSTASCALQAPSTLAAYPETIALTAEYSGTTNFAPSSVSTPSVGYSVK